MSRDPASARLRGRIYDVFPVNERNFARLLALLEIEASGAVPTAAVTLGDRSRLLINPRFVADHCATDHDLVMLVLHELYHVVLGHSRLYPRVTPAQNWAFDCVINAQLCLMYPQPQGTALFRRLYDPDRFPEALLRPPAGWRTDQEQWLPGRAGEVHRTLYSDRSVSYGDLHGLLAGVMEESGWGLAGDRLLGDHGLASVAGLPTDVLRELRGLAAGWPMDTRRSGEDQAMGRCGAQDASQAASQVALARRNAEAVRTVRRALLAVADLGEGGLGVPTRASAPASGVLPYAPRPHRADFVRLALGSAVLLHPATVVAERPVPRERVHLYLDVSGSMGWCLPAVYAALAPLGDLVHPQVHLFSTAVHDVEWRVLLRGACVSTCGTDVAPVTSHLLAHGIRRAVLLTDGFVGRVPADHARALSKRGTRCAVVLTANGNARFADPLSARVWRLPDELRAS
jgi:hypothetical protein